MLASVEKVVLFHCRVCGSWFSVTEVIFDRIHRISMICRMKPVALSFIMLLSFVAVAGQGERKQLDALRADGYDALYNLDYEGARKRFQKMIDLAPNHPAGAQCFASSLWLDRKSTRL